MTFRALKPTLSETDAAVPALLIGSHSLSFCILLLVMCVCVRACAYVRVRVRMRVRACAGAHTHRHSQIQFFATPWTVAHQASLSIGFSRQEYWGGLPFPTPRDLSHPGIEPKSFTSHALANWFLTTSTTQDNTLLMYLYLYIWWISYRQRTVGIFNSLWQSVF